jgi:hypothetical protein
MEIDLGGKFACKLLETLKESGIGLAKPWQTRRVGKAQVDIQTYEIRQIAAAEKDAEDIRNGIKTIDQQGNIVLAPVEVLPSQSSSDSLSLNSNSHQLLADAQARVRYRELKREVNLRAIALLAQEEAYPDEQVSDSKVNDQWTARWIDGAQDVSDEQLRVLWAKLLAGEVRRPGSYSLHTIEYLRRVSPGEAKNIERIACLALKDYYSGAMKKNTFIYKGEDSLKDISKNLILELEEAGIMNTATLGFTVKLAAVKHEEKWIRALQFQDRLLFAETDDPKTELSLKVFRLTSLGAEIISLGHFEINRDYLGKVIGNIKAQGFRVFEAAIVKDTDDGLEIEDERTEH